MIINIEQLIFDKFSSDNLYVLFTGLWSSVRLIKKNKNKKNVVGRFLKLQYVFFFDSEGFFCHIDNINNTTFCFRVTSTTLVTGQRQTLTSMFHINSWETYWCFSDLWSSNELGVTYR